MEEDEIEHTEEENENDDGADVFYDYVNFNGTNLPTTYYVTSNGWLLLC